MVPLLVVATPWGSPFGTAVYVIQDLGDSPPKPIIQSSYICTHVNGDGVGVNIPGNIVLHELVAALAQL